MEMPSGIELIILFIVGAIAIKIMFNIFSTSSYESENQVSHKNENRDILYSYDHPYEASRTGCIYYDCPECQRLYHAAGAFFVTPACENCGAQLIQRPMKGENKFSKTICSKGGSHTFEFFNSFGSEKRRCKKCSYIDPDYYIPNYYK